jgi:hypothetical protein
VKVFSHGLPYDEARFDKIRRQILKPTLKVYLCYGPSRRVIVYLQGRLWGFGCDSEYASFIVACLREQTLALHCDREPDVYGFEAPDRVLYLARR